MNDCLFCKIVKREIPNYTVYEDENVLAFLDIHPCANGHTIVVSKKHFADILEMDQESFILMAAGLRAAAALVQAKLKPDGLNIGINNGSAAGQAVAHAHWHIIPRWQGDGGGSMHSIIRQITEDPKDIAKLFAA